MSRGDAFVGLRGGDQKSDERWSELRFQNRAFVTPRLGARINTFFPGGFLGAVFASNNVCFQDRTETPATVYSRPPNENESWSFSSS
jgi:hypothetical protein